LGVIFRVFSILGNFGEIESKDEWGRMKDESEEGTSVFGRMVVLRRTGGFARARRAARNGERKGAFSGGEWGFIFWFALARGCARRARGAHRTGNCSRLPVPVSLPDRAREDGAPRESGLDAAGGAMVREVVEGNGLGAAGDGAPRSPREPGGEKAYDPFSYRKRLYDPFAFSEKGL